MTSRFHLVHHLKSLLHLQISSIQSTLHALHQSTSISTTSSNSTEYCDKAIVDEFVGNLERQVMHFSDVTLVAHVSQAINKVCFHLTIKVLFVFLFKKSHFHFHFHFHSLDARHQTTLVESRQAAVLSVACSSGAIQPFRG